MSDEPTPTFTTTTTIGRVHFEEQIAHILSILDSHTGQCMHFTSLCRTRDAQNQLNILRAQMTNALEKLVTDLFES